MLEAAKARLTASGEGRDEQYTFEMANAEAIPHPPNRFDAVFANHMLYHVRDRPKALNGTPAPFQM